MRQYAARRAGLFGALVLAGAVARGGDSGATKRARDLTDVMRRRLEIGGSSSASITVAVRPGNVTLNPGQAQQFTAAVAGPANTEVTWAVLEADGGRADCSGAHSRDGCRSVRPSRRECEK